MRTIGGLYMRFGLGVLRPGWFATAGAEEILMSLVLLQSQLGVSQFICLLCSHETG